ncbi:MAG TPA: NAD-dependent epimerase/dehydratase family protein [Acidimicrobiales bacterium]|nr:NAD-dependent epimerase/dehydratase family protein [Acidimicrobiales bacterium]
MPDERHPDDRSARAGSLVVAVTGAEGTIGRRVVAELGPLVARVVVVDPDASDLKRVLEDVDTLVHLAFAVGPLTDDAELALINSERTRRLLDAAGGAGIDHVVLLSSAAVYGAWANNPVPLTEDAPVRPNAGFGFAVQKAELERLAGEWADEHPAAALTILRPAVPMDREQHGFLSDALGVRAAVAIGDPDVPVQFVHLDDLATAVVHVVRRRLDGVFNVAADGWITAGEARALAGAPPRVPVPDRVRALLARLGRRPSAAAPYTVHPWVVATDRLRATGWAPVHANDVTVVDTTEGMPWSRLSPRRKQELALGASVAGAALAAAGVVILVRWVRRRRAPT